MESTTNTPAWMKVTEVELIYKTIIPVSHRPLINKSKMAYEILLNHWDDNKLDFVEQFKIILLNRANRVLGVYELSTGGVSSTTVDPKLIFTAALKANASRIMLAHNHPSGNLQPSHSDELMTQRIVAAGMLLDLPVLDHLIIGREGYYSFADEGLL